MTADLLPGDRHRVHLAKAAISAGIRRAQVAYAELARTADDHEASSRALVELDAALGELGAARTATRELYGL